MVSKAKLYAQLDRLEDELRERIIPHLENAANGKNNLVFCATDFNPFPELKFRTDNETDELIQIGRKILALKKKLGEPSQGSVAERICWYCRKWADSGDSHGKSVQVLARVFVHEVVNAKPNK